MKNQIPMVADELRNASRFDTDPDTTVAVIIRDQGEEILAAVHDESLHGIGLLLEASHGFLVGQSAWIILKTSVVEGIVRHIEPKGSGKCLVGFQCD